MMKKSITKLFILLFVSTAFISQAGNVLDSGWSDVARSRCSDQNTAWWSSAEAIRIAENVLLYQRDIGGWQKNTDFHLVLTEAQKTALIRKKSQGADCTIDNGAVAYELQYLSKAYKYIEDEDVKSEIETGFLKGIDYLITMQYDNGGWPQFYPYRGGYSNHITYNDDAMVNVMEILKHVYLKDRTYSILVDDAMAEKAQTAFDKGVECILKTQYILDGKLTAWCAQHHYETLEPVMARSYELASISGAESANIIALLRNITDPSDEIKRAIYAASKWYDESRIKGQRLEDYTNADGLADKHIVFDENASDMWGRFYTLDKNRPYFCDRDGVIKYTIAEIGHERRNGYSWYNTSGSSVVSSLFSWRRKNRSTLITCPLPDADYEKIDTIFVHAYANKYASESFVKFDLLVDGQALHSFTEVDMDTFLTGLSGGKHEIMVKAIYENDYVESDTTFVTLPIGLGVNDAKHNLTQSFCYPNPVSTNLTVDLEEFGPADITIYNMQGKVMYTVSSSQSIETISVGFLNKGQYVVQITNDANTTRSSKILVQ